MRKCPSCGQLTLDEVPGRNYLQCTRYSCGHREPVVDPKDARIAEFEARWNMSNLGSTERVDTLLENTSGLRLTYKGLIA